MRKFWSAAALAAALFVSTAVVSAQAEVIELGEGDGYVRVAHFAVDAGPVDVFVDGETLFEGLQFGQLLEYIPVADLPLDIEVALSPAGEGIDAAVLGPITITLEEGQGTLISAIGSIANGTLDISTVLEDLSDPGEGSANLYVHHLIDEEVAVDVLVDGEAVAEGLEFGDIANLLPEAATYDIQVTVAGEPDNVIFDLPGTELDERVVYLIAAIGTLDDPQIVIYGVDLTTMLTTEIVSEGTFPLSDGSTLESNTTAAGGLDASAESSFGDVDLEAGFTPDPISNNVETGGDVDVSALDLGAGCLGTVTTNPIGVINWSGDSELLRLFVVSEADTTLVIALPDGSYLCNDDTSGLNPQIDIVDPEEGAYAVWVGSYTPGEVSDATVYVTELETTDATTVGE